MQKENKENVGLLSRTFRIKGREEYHCQKNPDREPPGCQSCAVWVLAEDGGNTRVGVRDGKTSELEASFVCIVSSKIHRMPCPQTPTKKWIHGE